MGNAHFKLIEDNANLPIDQSFLQKYQKHVTAVDQTLTGLARGIDALQTTCQLFFHQYSKSTDGQGKEMSVSTSEEAVILIIQKIHECISDNKEVTIESLKNFFSFIKETGEVYIENADEAFSSLSVNTYQGLLSGHMNQDELFTDFYKKRNEHLKKEIETLQKENKIQHELIETLKKQLSCILDKDELKKEIKDWIKQNSPKDERSVSKCSETVLKTTTEQPKTIDKHSQTPTDESAAENDQSIIILRENEALKKELIECKSMNENIQQQVQLLKEDKSKIEKELQEKSMIMQLTTKKVIVQVYSRYYFSSTKDPEEDLFTLLGTEFSKRDLELTIRRCGRLSQVADGCPLLVTVNHSVSIQKRNVTIDTAMAGIEYSKDRAVLVFHLTAEKDLPNEIKLYDLQYKSLGGVIHFGYKSSLYPSPINKESIKEVIAFIEKFGKVQQNVVETYC